ncbi:MAG TPA: CheR family methyltransferase, partial [Verrucomicrobiae bacterium]|nr:CheR family methyltransferase [Verrucomicrobiae bacterium]
MKTLLQHLPPDTGMTFLYVQHLDPSHESALDQVLTRWSPIGVSQVTRGVRIQSDHLYICPSDKDLVLHKAHLKLLPRKVEKEKHLPIDRLLVSVATSCGSNAIGILLSGNSADGTAGLSAIRSAGGKTFVQDATAQFGTMPESAVANGVVDQVLAPEQIAAELGRIAKKNGQPKPLSSAAGMPPADNDGVLDEIYRILVKSTGIDFSLYKKATIKRRIVRRIRLLKLSTWEEYAEFLRLHGPEAETISQDLLIHVTSFFRFPQAFAYLKQSIIPRILRSKGPGEVIRIWVPACSSGEEVYSIAMVLMEVLAGRHPGKSIQIFASDLSEKVLAKARSGVYTHQELKGVSRERLAKFFSRTDNGYRITKAIRDLCIFSKHNVFSDPPITRIDLVSCANLLIYLENTLQKKVLANFYFALNPDGYLMLGRSETAGAAQNFFTDHNKRFRIYTKVPNAAARAIMEMNYRLPGVQQSITSPNYKHERPEPVKPKTVENVVDDLLL